MLLKHELDQLNTALVKQLPPEVLRTLANATKELSASRLAESSMQKGARAPGFALPDASGKIVKLEELLRRGPVVVSFFRGAWCPYCSLELAALQKALPRIRESGAELVAISPQKPASTAETVEKHHLSFDVLIDQGNRVAQTYGLTFSLPEAMHPIYTQLGVDLPRINGDETFGLPMPATYVIAQDGVIAHAFVDADYSRRLEPNEILAALKNLKTLDGLPCKARESVCS